MTGNVKKKVILLLLMLAAFVTMPLASFAFTDHGFINVNGTRVTTKAETWITESWQDGSPRSNITKDNSGVVIDNYIFKLNEVEKTFIVKDRDSGVEKRLEKEPIINRDDTYTVLKGFNNGKAYYSLLHYDSVNNHIQCYEFQPDSAFNNAVEKISASYKYQWVPTPYKVESIIRIPSLLSDKNPEDFCNNDFAIVILKNPIIPNIRFYQPLEWDKCFQDGNLTERKFYYLPHIKHKGREGYLEHLSSLSGTTYIDKNGCYCALIGVNCWGNVGGKNHPYAAMKMVHFKINLHKKENEMFHTLELFDTKDYTLVNDGYTYESDCAVAATWAEKISGSDKAKQVYGFVSPYNREHKEFYCRGWSQAVYDWSEETLNKYNIHPKIENKTSLQTGEGAIVQGMVLSVPLHPELYKKNLNSSVDIKNSISCTEWNGTKSSIGNSTTVECGACTPVFSVSASATAAWSQEKDSTHSKTFTSGTDTKLKDYRENLIFGVVPAWEAKSAVLKGNDNENVRYANSDKNPNAYVTIAAVMGEGSKLHKFNGSTENPGKQINDKKDLILTKGMQPYQATKFDENDDGKLYNDYVKMCSNLKKLAEKEIIEKKITAGSINSLSDEDNTWFTITDKDSSSCLSTASISAKLSVKVANISNISNETKASITKSYGTSFTKEDGCAFSYTHTGDKKDIDYNHDITPVIYWIPVSKLKAKYKSRTDDVDLKFIPDYMWENSMDYWLIAYQINGETLSK